MYKVDIMEAYRNSGLIIGAIVVILIIRMIIGYWASKKGKTTTNFVLAGRRLPWWMAAPSIMATWFAAETLMGFSAQAYLYGFHGVVFDPFGAPIYVVLSAFLVVHLARRVQYVTIMDFLQIRYGTTMSMLGANLQIVAYVGLIAAQIIADGSILHAILGLPLATGKVLVAAIVSFHTMLGRLWADTTLDFMQMFLTSVVVFFIVSPSTHKINPPKTLLDLIGKPLDMRRPLGVFLGEMR